MAKITRDELIILRDRSQDMYDKGATFNDYSVDWPPCALSGSFTHQCDEPAWVPLLSPYCYTHTIVLRGGTLDCLHDDKELEPWGPVVLVIPN